MTDMLTAADNVRRFAKQFEGILAVADTLEELGKLDQITAERRAAAVAAAEQLEKAKVELAAMQSRIQEIAEDSKAAAAVARTKAEAMAADIKRAAEEDAAGILKAAQDEAAKQLATAASDKARMSSELDLLTTALEDGKAMLAKQAEDREASEKATAAAEKKFNDLQAKLRAMVAVE